MYMHLSRQIHGQIRYAFQGTLITRDGAKYG